jgi:antitoxin component of MazEF toxin-antitoxin module
MKQEEIILKDKRIIQRIGNSRGITLPKKILEFLNSPVIEIKMVRRGYNIEILIEKPKKEEEK